MSFTTMRRCHALVSLLLSIMMLSTTSCETLDSITEIAKEKTLENKEMLIGGLAGKTKGAIIGGTVGLVSSGLIGMDFLLAAIK